MTSTLRDPLLLAAKAILAFFIGLLGLVTLALATGAVAFPFLKARLSAEMVIDGGPAIGNADALMMSGTILLLAVLVGLLVYFLLLLWRIVRSVGEGDPFIPANARRLSLMGWSLLAFNLIGILAAIALAQLERFFDEAEAMVQTDFTDGGTWLLMLVVFVLARVFRQGAAMREDLEGTV